MPTGSRLHSVKSTTTYVFMFGGTIVS